MYYFFLIIDFIALIVLAVCLFIINEQQTGQSQKLMNSLCTWCLFITFGFCVKISGTELATQLLGQKIVYMGILHVLYFKLLFVMTFCNISIKRPLEIILFVNNFIKNSFSSQRTRSLFSPSTLYTVSALQWCPMLILRTRSCR